MKKWVFALALFLLLPLSGRAAAKIEIKQEEGAGNSLALFVVSDEENADNAALMQLILDGRFSQNEAKAIFDRAVSRQEEKIRQKAYLGETEGCFSMALRWNGEQPDGIRGSKIVSYAIDTKTGTEQHMSDLFLQKAEYLDRLNEIVEQDVLPGLSDYLEFSELLPVPEDCFYFDESGITVFYEEDRYRYFSGDAGAIHFAWFEVADLLNPEGPAGPYSASKEEESVLLEQASQGTLPGLPFRIGDTLGQVLANWPELSDPDYTRDAKLYLFEDARLRGAGVEIAKYADTEEEDTPLCTVRTKRLRAGQLTTGWTGRDDIVALLGDPSFTYVYDEQTAEDMFTVPGESLLYTCGDNVLELHLDGESILAEFILRSERPAWMF